MPHALADGANAAKPAATCPPPSPPPQPPRTASPSSSPPNEDGSTRSSAASKPRSMISTGRPPQPGSAGSKPPASTPPSPETRSASARPSKSPGDASNSLNNRSGPPHAVVRRATGNQPTVTSSSPSRRRPRMRSQGCSRSTPAPVRTSLTLWSGHSDRLDGSRARGTPTRRGHRRRPKTRPASADRPVLDSTRAGSACPQPAPWAVPQADPVATRLQGPGRPATAPLRQRPHPNPPPGYPDRVVHRFQHDQDPLVRVISGPDPEHYDAAWQAWLAQLDDDEPVDPDVPAALELARARDAGEV